MADKINPFFHHFKFVFYDLTQEGGVFETLRMVCDGTDYWHLNHSDQILTQIDLICGLQEMNGLSLPIWIDNVEAINSDRLPEIEQQMIVLEVSDGDLEVSEI